MGEQTKRKEEQIGDAVLEAKHNKRDDRQDRCSQLVANALTGEPHPDGQAHKNVAEDTAHERHARGKPRLGERHRKGNLPHRTVIRSKDTQNNTAMQTAPIAFPT